MSDISIWSRNIFLGFHQQPFLITYHHSCSLLELSYRVSLIRTRSNGWKWEFTGECLILLIFIRYRVFSSSNGTTHTVFCRSWTYCLMNFSQKEAILFTFSLYHEFRTRWELAIQVVWAWSGQTCFLDACVWFFTKGRRWIDSSCHLSLYKSPSAFTSVIRRLNCVFHLRILHCLIHASLGSKKSLTVLFKLHKNLFTTIIGHSFFHVFSRRLLNCSCLVGRSRSHSEPTWSCTRSTILYELCVSFLLINSLFM